MIATVAGLLNNGWVEDIGTWLLGLGCGLALGKRHLGRHMAKLHERLERIEQKL